MTDILKPSKSRKLQHSDKCDFTILSINESALLNTVISIFEKTNHKSILKQTAKSSSLHNVTF